MASVVVERPGMPVKRFEDFVCWQLSHELKCEVYAFTDALPAGRDRNFCDDIRASSRSAPSNIAEGFGRETHREFAQFLAVARGSLIETDNHLQDGLDCGYLPPVEHQRRRDADEASLDRHDAPAVLSVSHA